MLQFVIFVHNQTMAERLNAFLPENYVSNSEEDDLSSDDSNLDVEVVHDGPDRGG